MLVKLFSVSFVICSHFPCCLFHVHVRRFVDHFVPHLLCLFILLSQHCLGQPSHTLSSFLRHSLSCVLRHLLFASFTQVFGCLALPRIWVVIFRARVSVSQSWTEEQEGTLLMYSKILNLPFLSPYIVPEIVPANSGGSLVTSYVLKGGNSVPFWWCRVAVLGTNPCKFTELVTLYTFLTFSMGKWLKTHTNFKFPFQIWPKFSLELHS